MAGYDWPFVSTSMVLACLAAALLVPLIADLIKHAHRVIQIKGALAGDEQSSIGDLLLADFCTNGISLCRLPARLILKVSFCKHTIGQIQTVLGYRIPGSNARALSESLFALGVLCGLLAAMISGQGIIGLACAVLPFAYAGIQAKKWLRNRQYQLREQLPDALRGLGMCFMAGLSLEQAFEQTASESRDPLKRELSRTVDDLHTGSSILESLDNLDTRLAMDEMRFVSVALEIQHRSGGSMREVLDAAADSMFASFDLSRSLEVQTAQARMSARIVSVLPLALVLVLSVAMEGYLATFFSSPMGFGLLVCALGMELTGIFAVRRILRIDLR